MDEERQGPVCYDFEQARKLKKSEFRKRGLKVILRGIILVVVGAIIIGATNSAGMWGAFGWVSFVLGIIGFLIGLWRTLVG